MSQTDAIMEPKWRKNEKKSHTRMRADTPGLAMAINDSPLSELTSTMLVLWKEREEAVVEQGEWLM